MNSYRAAKTTWDHGQMISKGPLDEAEYERRLRLVLLTYEVLKDMEKRTDEGRSAGMFTRLSRAFFDNTIDA